MDDAGIHLCKELPELMKSLSEDNIFDMPPGKPTWPFSFGPYLLGPFLLADVVLFFQPIYLLSLSWHSTFFSIYITPSSRPTFPLSHNLHSSFNSAYVTLSYHFTQPSLSFHNPLQLHLHNSFLQIYIAFGLAESVLFWTNILYI